MMQECLVVITFCGNSPSYSSGNVHVPSKGRFKGRIVLILETRSLESSVARATQHDYFELYFVKDIVFTFYSKHRKIEGDGQSKLNILCLLVYCVSSISL